MHRTARALAIFFTTAFFLGVGALTQQACAQDNKLSPDSLPNAAGLPKELEVPGFMCVTVAERDELQKLMTDYNELASEFSSAQSVLNKYAAKGYYGSSEEMNENEAARVKAAAAKPKLTEMSARFTQLIAEIRKRPCPPNGAVTIKPRLPPYHVTKSKEIPDLPCMTAAEKKTLQDILDKLVPVEEKKDTLDAEVHKIFAEQKTIPSELSEQIRQLVSQENALVPEYNKLIEEIYHRPCPPPGTGAPVSELPKHDAKTCPTCRTIASQIADLDDQIASWQRQDQSLRKNADLSNAGIQGALKDISNKIAELNGKKAGLEAQRSECEKKCIATEQKKTGEKTGGGKTKNHKAGEKKRGKKDDTANETAIVPPISIDIGIGGFRRGHDDSPSRRDDRPRDSGGSSPTNKGGFSIGR